MMLEACPPGARTTPLQGTVARPSSFAREASMLHHLPETEGNHKKKINNYQQNKITEFPLEILPASGSEPKTAKRFKGWSKGYPCQIEAFSFI